MARGLIKGTWSSTMASETGIGTSTGGGTVELPVASFVHNSFGVPSPAMACGWWDAARIDGDFGVDENKVEKKRV